MDNDHYLAQTIPHVAVISTDENGVIQVFNDGAESLLGFRAEEIIGKVTPLKFHIDDELQPYKQNIAIDKDPSIIDHELLHAISKDQSKTWTYIHRDGHSVHVRLNVSPIQSEDGSQNGLLFVATKCIPMIKSLADLPGEAVFEKVLEREFRRCKRLEEPVSLLKIDIDHYQSYLKATNPDTTEHLVIQLATLLSDRVQRAADVLFYHDHDEFSVLLPHTDKSGAVKMAELLRLLVANAALEHPEYETVTMSIGVGSIQPKREDEAQQLVDMAKNGLQQAKTDGRNCSRIG